MTKLYWKIIINSNLSLQGVFGVQVQFQEDNSRIDLSLSV